MQWEGVYFYTGGPVTSELVVGGPVPTDTGERHVMIPVTLRAAKVVAVTDERLVAADSIPAVTFEGLVLAELKPIAGTATCRP